MLTAQITSSFCSSLYLIIPASERTKTPLVLCTANSIGLSLAYFHLSSFWKGKAQVPLAKDYNEAVEISNVMRQFLIGLAISWWGAALYYFPKALGLI